MARTPKWAWRRVSTMLPEPHSVVWTWGPDFWAITLAYHTSERWESIYGDPLPKVTIWHPLDKPDLPESLKHIR